MSWTIRLCGGLLILMVFGILYFIVMEALPLFRSPVVKEAGQVEHSAAPLVMGVDEWGEMPFVYSGGSSLQFLPMGGGDPLELEIPGLEGSAISAFAFDPLHQRMTLGLEDGRVGSFKVVYERKFGDDPTEERIEASLLAEPWFGFDEVEGKVRGVHYGDADTSRQLVIRHGEEGERVTVLMLTRKRALIGEAKLTVLGQIEVTDQLSGSPRMVRASHNGTTVLVACDNGIIDYFERDGAELIKRQSFQPFDAQEPQRMDFLFGGVSALLISQQGQREQWSLFRRDKEGERLFGKTKEFIGGSDGPSVFANSQRNRSFLLVEPGYLFIHHSTSGDLRWQSSVDYQPVAGVIDGKNQHVLVADSEGMIHRYAFDDPHPEASLKAFFGKVWYEGGDGLEYKYRATGGSADFEPKLSLVPLIFGSIKGTAYAMLFSVPVALLAAIFSAAFLPQPVKRVIKPMMEIMATLPSVVLGFLAVVWLAPLLETRVPSVVLMVVMVPIGALAVGLLWSRFPVRFRRRVEGCYEWLLVIPFMLLAGGIGWALGPLIESWWFIYRDPETGKAIADFRLWWPQVTGQSFEQQNSLVLGFIMGFAVIPVIFTIAEDALVNVPRSLTSASAALGANRWQVVWTVMLPVAAPGIFSALMIGFGRAVGETMIMVMATGNTPLMEWNLFNGMRTLAANIAIELPEATPDSTLYRTLLLSAVVLFLMTSVMNTIAEVLRQRLRERNKQI